MHDVIDDDDADRGRRRVPVLAEPGRSTVSQREPAPVAMQAAVVAATSFVAGVATVAVVRSHPLRRMRTRRRRRDVGRVLASRSFLVDVHSSATALTPGAGVGSAARCRPGRDPRRGAPRIAVRLPRRRAWTASPAVRGGVLERLLHVGGEPVVLARRSRRRTVLLGAWAPTARGRARQALARMRFALGVDDDLARSARASATTR